MKRAFCRIKILLVLAFSFIWAYSCKKESAVQAKASGQYSYGLWVANEGTYGFGNCSVDFYHKDSRQYEKNVFANVNGRPLGDVLQSIYAYNGKYYLMVNNSHVVEVVDGTTFKSVGTIKDLNSPRYLLPLNDQKAYLTDLYARALWVVNPSTYKISAKIPYVSGKGDEFYGWTEQMLPVGDKVWVCGVKTGQIVIIDSKRDSITDSIQIGIKPQWIDMDKEGRVWVLCNGNYEQKLSRLHCIDPSNRKIVKSYTFPTITDNPIRMKFNPGLDSIFFINQGVYKMDIHANALPALFILAGGRNLYGLGIDPEDASIFVSDGKDNVQPGTVYHYSRAGQLINSFEAGVSPSDFLFVKK